MAQRDGANKVVGNGPRRVRWWGWWPLAIPLFVAAWVMGVELAGRPELHAKRPQEVIAIILTAAALLAAIVHFLRSRQRFYLVLSVLAFSFMFREFHFEWTNLGVYLAIGAIGFWAFLWRRDLWPFVDSNPPIRIWLIAAAATYILSQVVARRAIQHIVGEESTVSIFLETMHGPFRVYGDLEEFLENTAHFMLLVTALVGSWGRPGE